MSERLFTRTFVLVCGSSLSHQISFRLLLAAMPLYVLKVGGGETGRSVAAGDPGGVSGDEKGAAAKK